MTQNETKLYTVSYTFEADSDQEASDIWRGGFYTEADPTTSWTLLPPAPKIDTGLVMADAVNLLRDAGILATYEHPGYIHVPVIVYGLNGFRRGVTETNGATGANFGDVNGDYTAHWGGSSGDFPGR